MDTTPVFKEKVAEIQRKKSSNISKITDMRAGIETQVLDSKFSVLSVGLHFRMSMKKKKKKECDV